MYLTTSAPITVSDLETHGFSPAQISRLQDLRATYDPYREYSESNREYEQLCFLKWRYAQGEMTETITG